MTERTTCSKGHVVGPHGWIKNGADAYGRLLLRCRECERLRKKQPKKFPPKPIIVPTISTKQYIRLMETYIEFQVTWNHATKKARERFFQAIPPARKLVEVVTDGNFRSRRLRNRKNRKPSHVPAKGRGRGDQDNTV
jgi:hypothetical protein